MADEDIQTLPLDHNKALDVLKTLLKSASSGMPAEPQPPSQPSPEPTGVTQNPPNRMAGAMDTLRQMTGIVPFSPIPTKRTKADLIASFLMPASQAFAQAMAGPRIGSARRLLGGLIGGEVPAILGSIPSIRKQQLSQAQAQQQLGRITTASDLLKALAPYAKAQRPQRVWGGTADPNVEVLYDQDESGQVTPVIDPSTGKPLSRSTKSGTAIATAQGTEPVKVDTATKIAQATAPIKVDTAKQIQAAKPIRPPAGTHVAAEIEAQIGPRPQPKDFQAGEKDPAYVAASKAWGKAAERIKNEEMAVRAETFQSAKAVDVFNPNTGTVGYERAGQAIKENAASSSDAQKIMSRQAQFNDMHVAVDKTRSAIKGLPSESFSPEMIAKLTLASRQDDPTIYNNEVSTLVGSQQLSPAEQDFLVWTAQLNERAMSLRNVAGMGQGSDTMRHAIQDTLASLRSGNKTLALKKMDAFENQINLLEKGVPKVKGSQAGGQSTNQALPPNQQAVSDAVARFRAQH